MEALVWTGPREMVLREEPTPRPGPGELLLATGAAGICGSELSGYLGESSLRRPPLIMGHEAAGRIVVPGGTLGDGSAPAVGARVTFNPLVVCGTCDRCRAGRSNLCRKRQIIGAHRPGAFARYVAVPAALCWPLPDSLSLVAGSLVEPLACGVRAVALGQAAPQERLLILGAGPIGLCCLAAARAVGVEDITISDISPRRLEVAAQWGARHTVNAAEQDVRAFVEAAHPGGVDLAIDAVGTGQVRDQAVRAVVPGGRVVLLGLHHEESLMPANYIIRQEVAITGSFSYTPPDFARALELLKAGVALPAPDWLETRPLSAGPASFAELVDGRAAATKIVLTLE
jgi:threonine dehydrogenase-like Zn-dependent dehydrogenase